MIVWVGKSVKECEEEITDERAMYYQLLLNFWKELETDRSLKAAVKDGGSSALSAPQDRKGSTKKNKMK